MFHASYLVSTRRLRQMRRILQDHHTFSVEVCLSEKSGTQTAAEKRSYKVALEPTISSTQSMGLIDRFLLRWSIVRHGQTRAMLNIVNQVLCLDFEESVIYPEPAAQVEGVWVRKFRVDLSPVESQFLLQTFSDQLQPV
jgi:hypothetical protein